MEDYYFTYYVFDFNMACALVVSALATLFLPVFPQRLPCWMFIVILIAIVTFAFDGYFLRKDIVKFSKDLPVAK